MSLKRDYIQMGSKPSSTASVDSNSSKRKRLNTQSSHNNLQFERKTSRTNIKPSVYVLSILFK